MELVTCAGLFGDWPKDKRKASSSLIAIYLLFVSLMQKSNWTEEMFFFSLSHLVLYKLKLCNIRYDNVTHVQN